MGEEIKVDGVVAKAEMSAKPGFKTTEFWLSLVAAIMGFVLASGAVVEGSTAATIAGTVLTALGVLGYTKGRTTVKVAEETRKSEEVKGASFVAYAIEKVKEVKEGRAKAEAERDAAVADSTPVATPVPDGADVAHAPLVEGKPAPAGDPEGA